MKGLKIITIRAWNMKEANTLSQISEKTGVPFIDNQRILTEAISFGADEEYFQWMIDDDCRSRLRLGDLRFGAGDAAQEAPYPGKRCRSCRHANSCVIRT